MSDPYFVKHFIKSNDYYPLNFEFNLTYLANVCSLTLSKVVADDEMRSDLISDSEETLEVNVIQHASNSTKCSKDVDYLKDRLSSLNIKESNRATYETLSNCVFGCTDQRALSFVHITKRTNVLLDLPPVEVSSREKQFTFDDVGGHEKVKTVLSKLVTSMTQKMSNLKHLGDLIPRSVILFGARGTGKTLLASALAGSTGLPLICLPVEQMSSRYHGEVEKHISAYFSLVRSKSPCIAFIDQLDIICPRTDNKSVSAVTETSHICETLCMEIFNLLNETSNVFLLAATNKINEIASDLRRSSCFAWNWS